MKTRKAMMTTIVLMAIQFTIAGEPAKKFATEEKMVAFATKNLLTALQSANTGLIESSMRLTAQMKMRYPVTDISKFVKILNDLAQNHPSGTTRYKAYIALSICENPEWYASETTLATASEENFFQIASNHMQEYLLSANSN